MAVELALGLTNFQIMNYLIIGEIGLNQNDVMSMTLALANLSSGGLCNLK